MRDSARSGHPGADNSAGGPSCSFHPNSHAGEDRPDGLELFFAEGFTRSDLAGQTFKLFDWTGVTPSGQFKILDPASWDASRLYIDGTVTLIPEPSCIAMVLAGFATAALRRRSVR